MGAIVAGFLGLLASFILYLHYLHKINDHLPGPPRSSFILGHVPDIWQCQRAGGTMNEYFMKKRLEYGPIYLVFFLHEPIVIVGDPVYVREVFIDFHNHIHKHNYLYRKLGFVFGERGSGYGLVSNADDESWRTRRQLLNPAFHKKYLKNYFMVDFNQVCDRLMERMNDVAESKEETSMLKEFARVTLDVISQVLLDVNIGAIEHPDSPIPTAIQSYLRGVQDNINNPLPPLRSWLYFSLESYKLPCKGNKYVQQSF